jgi:glucose/arabinose dehydrogenase
MGQPKLSSPDRWLEQDRAGAGVQSANRITLLRDADGDGVAEMRTVFLQGLNSPFGMALVGHDLYVANTDAIMRFTYIDGETQIRGLGDKVAKLPAGLINHHWTKNLIANRDGSRLYVTVGSNSNAAENGLDREEGRAAILEVDLTGALLDRLTHRVHILELNGESYRLKQSKARRRCATQPADEAAPAADPETGEITTAS